MCAYNYYHTTPQSAIFFPIVDEFFVIGDKVVKVEHTNVESRTLVWKLGRYSKGK